MQSTQLVASVKDFPSETLKYAAVLLWLRNNNLPSSILPQNSISKYILENESSSVIKEAIGHLQRTLQPLSLKDVEKVFELSNGHLKKRQLGAVYTPDYIIDYLLENSLNFFLEKSSGGIPIICDPSCGSGGFLIRAALLLKKYFNVSLSESFQNYLIGIDIDRESLEYAEILISLFLRKHENLSSNIYLKLVNKDTLLASREEIIGEVGDSRGFDIIATNPPYVKLQNLPVEYRRELKDRYSSLVSGNFSLAPLFLIKSYDLLSDQGISAFITQNNLFTSLSGRKIREFLQEKKAIRRIVDFGHHKIFPNVSAYTSLIFLEKNRRTYFEYATFATKPQVNPSELKNIKFSILKVDSLNSAKWRLAENKHLENLKKIEHTGIPLNVLANIRVGFATLKDSVFFVRNCDNVFCYVESLGVTYKIEKEITRPAIKVSSLHSEEDIGRNNLGVIFPYTKIHGRYQLIPEQEMKQQYPLAYYYLLTNKEVLAARDKGKKKYSAWYAWGRTQGMEAPGPKLLTKTFNKFPQFFLDKSDSLFCNGYGIFMKDATLFKDAPLNIFVLQKILNSNIMFYYAKLTSFQIEGNYQCYQKNFIEKFSVPLIEKDYQEKMLHMTKNELNEYLAGIYGIKIADIEEIINSVS